MLTAAILIGGTARRLGGQVKAALPVGGSSILTRQLDALSSIGIEHIVLVGRWTAEDRPSVPQVADAIEDGGALGGLYTALVTGTGDTVLVLAGDMPFVRAPLLERLARLEEGDDAVVPRTEDGLHPLCASYRRRVALRFKARLQAGRLSVRSALADVNVREIEPAEMRAFDANGTMLMNVNSPLDYERACRLAAGGSA